MLIILALLCGISRSACGSGIQGIGQYCNPTQQLQLICCLQLPIQITHPTSFAAKFVHTSLNKNQCSINCVLSQNLRLKSPRHMIIVFGIFHGILLDIFFAA
ncbi:uncharacterized protein LOC130783527 [Actinidia eriantha]|uniref:uncharacterized protein LOC130783527 n=1 Tax=Actinidia eriantha TaxID=165200 RepID=UPI00258AE1DE|nr:uncharacterized protein LOC130783527 [Actinidia eriantha]